MMYEVRRRKPEPLFLPTQGIFDLPHHTGMVWQELAFDNAVNYRLQEDGFQHSYMLWLDRIHTPLLCTWPNALANWAMSFKLFASTHNLMRTITYVREMHINIFTQVGSTSIQGIALEDSCHGTRSWRGVMKNGSIEPMGSNPTTCFSTNRGGGGWTWRKRTTWQEGDENRIRTHMSCLLFLVL